jgi:hypothetical protein
LSQRICLFYSSSDVHTPDFVHKLVCHEVTIQYAEHQLSVTIGLYVRRERSRVHPDDAVAEPCVTFEGLSMTLGIISETDRRLYSPTN